MEKSSLFKSFLAVGSCVFFTSSTLFHFQVLCLIKLEAFLLDEKCCDRYLAAMLLPALVGVLIILEDEVMFSGLCWVVM